MTKRKAKLKRGTRDLAKPRSQVRLMPCPWDFGATGPANRARESEIVDAAEPEIDAKTGEVATRNPNSIKHRRYKDMLEVYRDQGVITAKGYDAGRKLRAAWEQTQRSSGMDLAEDKVDRTIRPDEQAAVRADRMSAYIRVKRMIPREDDAILMAVVCEGHSIGWLRQYRAFNIDAGKMHLCAALDRLAVKLGV